MSKYRASYSSTVSTPARSKSTRKLDLNTETKSCSLPALPPSKYPASNVSNNRPRRAIIPTKETDNFNLFLPSLWRAKAKFKKSMSFKPAKPASFSIPNPSSNEWWLWKHNQWKPKHCRQHLATLYPLPSPDPVNEPYEDEGYSEIPALTVEPRDKPRCAACMNHRLEPVTLPCGHKFCRRCLAGLRQPLVSEFAHVISDPRAVVKCPIVSCHEGYVLCRSLINGDFRFTKIRPEDKIKDDSSYRHSLTELENKLRKIGLTEQGY